MSMSIGIKSYFFILNKTPWTKTISVKLIQGKMFNNVDREREKSVPCVCGCWLSENLVKQRKWRVYTHLLCVVFAIFCGLQLWEFSMTHIIEYFSFTNQHSAFSWGLQTTWNTRELKLYTTLIATLYTNILLSLLSLMEKFVILNF